MLSVVALFIAFVFAQDDNMVDLVEEHLVGARYDETHDRHRNLFSVKRLDDKTFGLSSVLRAKMFQNEEGDVFIGTSMYNNYKTFKGPQPLLKWNDDDKTFEEVSVQPALRTNIDAQAAINYFNTKDGNTWAYDALYAIQNSTVRNLGLIGGNGSSYIFKLDGDSFSATPSFTFFTNFSTSRSSYFETADGREFLWTFSWGPANPPNPIPGARTPILGDNRNANPQRCSLIEYKSGTWTLSQENFIGCPTRPRSPISFQNTAGTWVYFFPSFAGGVLTLNYRGAGNNPQWEATSDVLDGFGIPEAIELHHWVDEWEDVSYDMITATTPTAVRTYRLHWDTHFVEELPAVQITQGSPYDFSWFMPGERRCFVVGSAAYPGLQSLSPPAIYNFYTSIFCWDQSRDVWDLAIRFPAELCWFNQVFADPSDEDNSWYLATMHRAHLTSVSVKLYHLHLEGDDWVHIKFDEAPAVPADEQTASTVHENRHMIIATLSIVSFTVLVVLISLFMSLSGGGGSSGDYTSFNN